MFLSFRDPAGRLTQIDGRVLRVVTEAGASDLIGFLSTRTAREFQEKALLVKSTLLDPQQGEQLIGSIWHHDGNPSVGALVEHERIPFPTFPYEWSPRMLAEAGRLTLNIADSLLDEGFGLKDASPYNILFRGPQPVFVDVLSAERRDPLDPTWLPYAQFVRCFVLPLLVNAWKGVSISSSLLERRDGIEPEDVDRLLSPRQKLLRPALTLVTIPRWLSRRQNSGSPARSYEIKKAWSADQSKYTLRRLVKSLRRNLDQLANSLRQDSNWADYMRKHTYSSTDFDRKSDFVRDAITEFHPEWTLDVGCNTGFFSSLAAGISGNVVAIDGDPTVIDHVWEDARSKGLNILPAVVNFARPTPSTGWRNEECPSFLKRARDRFDVVLMLAVVHHLMANEGVPLAEIFRLAAELTRDVLIVEYVAPDDSMFRTLIRGRDALYAEITRESFEAAGRQCFECVRTQELGSTRSVYVFRKKKC